MVGEAAAFVDPLTSLGVTCAFRHASEAAAIITETDGPPNAGRRLSAYDRRVRGVADLYNSAITGLLYSPTLRLGFGLRTAARSYVILGYVTNSLYSRIRPTGALRGRLLDALLFAFRLWTRAWMRLGLRALRKGRSSQSNGPAADTATRPERS